MQVVDRRKTHLQDGDVYIGRKNSYYGLSSSIWENPFPITVDCNRSCAISKYEKYIREKLKNEWWRKELKKLSKSKRLVCWCSPLPCHGDVLIKLMREYGYLD